MIPKIADLKPAPSRPTPAAKILFEANVGNQIKEAAKAGRTEVLVKGLNDFPETRAKLIAEGYNLTAWRDMGVMTTISWS